ncbi:hypothetical protein IKE67_07135 [bacterium]|nr:hypothetical protein [bacterium]
MASIINTIANNSDVQSMIVSMFNKINSATINASKNIQSEKVKSISSADFVKSLEEQLQKSEKFTPEVNKNAHNEIGMPAGMTISDDNTITKDSFNKLLNSVMETLDENSDGKISQQEMENFTEKLSHLGNSETTGSLASSKAGEFLKNQATNFIQKLIDKYKDNSESILGIFV